ncbi:hypothetical protein PHLCEN_2v3200 [Hermanssonia centrifuga]|uniref:Uncharacterized protein n=1 Tax=Hermanssonia centrifuga TaxID=98765 RepID=A0A2R6R0W8_9APHY|nr:hypothetical protein PHLCEN_2v3200 [Hermanssonia centrifuga]
MTGSAKGPNQVRRNSNLKDLSSFLAFESMVGSVVAVVAVVFGYSVAFCGSWAYIVPSSYGGWEFGGFDHIPQNNRITREAETILDVNIDHLLSRH